MLAVRIGEKYTVEEWKQKMESEGYQWKDFNPETIDPEGTKWRNWHSSNRRKLIIAYHLWHIQAPGLVFYKPNPEYTPTPDHPLKGYGKFKAIYLHDIYPMSDVTLVEAEIINVNAKIEWLDGAPINIDRTTPTRLLTYESKILSMLLRGCISFIWGLNCHFPPMDVMRFVIWEARRNSLRTETE